MSALDLAAARAASQAVVDEVRASIEPSASWQADKLRVLADFVQQHTNVFSADKYASIELRYGGFNVQFSHFGHGWKRVLFALDALADVKVRATSSGEDVHVIVDGSVDGVPTRVLGIAEGTDAELIRAAVEWSVTEVYTSITADQLREFAEAVAPR